MTKKPVLIFDVNETLLDLDHVAPLFEDTFGDPAVLREWFAQLILYSQTMSLAGQPADFANLAGGVLRMTGAIRNVAITDDHVADLKEAIGTMPAHPDAASSLQMLREKGFRLATLTNSAPSGKPSALDLAGLGDFFEQKLSVAPTGRFKPHPATYQMASTKLQVPLEQMCLVACHVWDTIGLQSLGGKGALVTHGVNAPIHADGVPLPDLVAPTLGELVQMVDQAWGDLQD
ncbi:haloacid dehalogenase type II [Falsirhodobacter sp. alg1]|uniref:haloacid dehalogenase type II n=1 Tax=Falsirhodobacter sp. alg1 TaxID=1472418 RepID=UPI0005EEA5AF|nr:haloacid dehalogenase type II [Falsirhodobacter sp. alg1]